MRPSRLSPVESKLNNSRKLTLTSPSVTLHSTHVHKDDITYHIESVHPYLGTRNPFSGALSEALALKRREICQSSLY